MAGQDQLPRAFNGADDSIMSGSTEKAGEGDVGVAVRVDDPAGLALQAVDGEGHEDEDAPEVRSGRGAVEGLGERAGAGAGGDGPDVALEGVALGLPRDGDGPCDALLVGVHADVVGPAAVEALLGGVDGDGEGGADILLFRIQGQVQQILNLGRVLSVL